MSTCYYGYTLPCPCSSSYQFSQIGECCGNIKSAVLEFSSSAEISAKGVFPYAFKPVDTIGVKLNPNGSFSLPVGIYSVSFSITATLGTETGNLAASLQSIYPGSTIYNVQIADSTANEYETLTGNTVIKVCNCAPCRTNPSYFQIVNTSHAIPTSSTPAETAAAAEPVITTYYPITPLTPNGLSTSTLTIIKLG